MNHYDTETLRLLSREHHSKRLREANAERLARDLRVARQPRRRPRLTIGPPLHHLRHAHRPRFTA
jgi:hypothetical protein